LIDKGFARSSLSSAAKAVACPQGPSPLGKARRRRGSLVEEHTEGIDVIIIDMVAHLGHLCGLLPALVVGALLMLLREMPFAAIFTERGLALVLVLPLAISTETVGVSGLLPSALPAP
jgi:hypothetical protein